MPDDPDEDFSELFKPEHRHLLDDVLKRASKRVDAEIQALKSEYAKQLAQRPPDPDAPVH